MRGHRFANLFGSAAPAPAPAPFAGAGNVKPGASAWWGLRAYSLATCGTNCVDIYDTVATTTQTFKTLANGSLDTASIATFLNGHAGKVSKLWDQSGNGWHLTQATVVNMPDFILADPQIGNQPALSFTRSIGQTLSSGATGLSSTVGTFSSVSRRMHHNSEYCGIMQAAPLYGIGYAAGPNSLLLFTNAVNSIQATNDFNHECIQWVFNGAASNVSVNGNVTASSATSPAFGSPFVMGTINNTLFHNGQISEVGFWNSVWSAADSANMYANQKAFWFGKATYEGSIASRARPTQTNDATNKYVMSRSAHIASLNISTLRILANVGSSNAYTITASVEYPAGTFTQLKAEGVSPWAIATTQIAYVLSDYANVSIPAGATFWIRIFFNAASGISYNTWQNTFLGEACAVSATAIPDQTMSGTITNSGAFSMPPIMILGPTSAPSVVIIGDSIAFGYPDVEDSSNTAAGYSAKVGIIARSLGSVPFVNFSLSGTTAASFGNMQNWWGRASHLICDLGINDLRTAVAASTVIASLQKLAQLKRPNQKFYQNTVTPGEPTTIDGWTTVTGQTVSSYAPARATFNTTLRGGVSGIDGIYDIASVLESSLNSGKWTVTPTPPYTGDGLHPNVAGYALVPPSGVVSPVSWP